MNMIKAGLSPMMAVEANFGLSTISESDFYEQSSMKQEDKFPGRDRRGHRPAVAQINELDTLEIERNEGN